MEVCNSFHHVFLIMAIFMCFIIPLVTGLSFNFSSFSTNDQNITYEKAYPADQAIQLTRNLRDADWTFSCGRATFYKPMQLWDTTSRNLTDFTTHFSFSINSLGRPKYGDGLAFFLAPEGSLLPPDLSQGSSLGLTGNNQQLKTADNHFVAVEFDVFQNFFDPSGNHVGIDINSMQSVNNITWFTDILGGSRNEAWISYNSATHNLSVEFTGYRNGILVMQHLSQVVDLRDYLPERVVFGFSAATGNLSSIHTIYSWDFSSTLEVYYDESGTSNPDPRSPKGSEGAGSVHGKGQNRTALPVGLSVGGILLAGAGLVWFFVRGRGGNEEKEKNVDFDNTYDDKEGCHVLDEYMDDELEKGTGPKKFSYQELAEATNYFKIEEKLGEGGFGGVYKGFLKDLNLYIAVKRVSRGSKQGIKEYAAEVKIISRLRHRNLVQLVGWCHERKELLLVYEFLPNGSLDSHIFKEGILLDWEVRYRIAKGLASGLLYLHEEWEQCVVHRDIKSSNIMLDSDFNAKLGDFGLARLMDHGNVAQTTVLAGTMGYMAPECMTTGKASKETDVYSFGIVALEIACGRKTINPKASLGQVYMVQWVWELYGQGKLIEAADTRLSGVFDAKQMERLMIVGLWCAHPDENLRPPIRKAIHVLSFEAALPNLPPKMPVPTYLSPSVSASSLSLTYGLTDTNNGGQNQSSTYSCNTNSSHFAASSVISSSSSSASLLHTQHS